MRWLRTRWFMLTWAVGRRLSDPRKLIGDTVIKRSEFEILRVDDRV